ncbi:alpha-1,6-glucosidase domain-containing protein [Mitsuaria sp. 7]|uniref:alpha-1,6-glucosidase domain-containing protein n=1 Tax=Mitsuaria sp. 7 TaxID=1658665 RepID=UPI0007DDB5C3|nr:alpha-1,6-glucosidase domain-containing protein [Mitsuaria sp. 7]ANH66755.1 alpha-1,6-glucosidase [Mitsuaria sp. 7]
MGVRSTLSRAWPRLAALTLSGMAGMPLAMAMAAADPSLAACDVGPVTMLRPQAPTLPTQTGTSATPQPVWLDARRLRWPGLTLAAGEVVRWHHSATGGLSLSDGHVSGSDRSVALRTVDAAREPLDAALAAQSAYLGAGAEFALEEGVDPAAWQRGQALITVEDAQGRVMRWSAAQTARALDAIYAAAEDEPALGVTVTAKGAAFKLWAPTADRVELCAYPGPDSAASARLPLNRDERTGIWSVDAPSVRSGSYYRYLVELFVPGVGRVRNLVTDPYSVSLSADSARSYVADLSEPRLQPRGWATSRIPDRVKTPTDMVVYELHVRDFSRDDRSVPVAQRGKYLAFTQSGSAGMRHLRALSEAGLTDVHLLPIFDLATVPERGCVVPRVPKAAPDGEAQQAAVMAAADKDCFNWGYDPFHYSAPEGSFASDANDGAVRVRELRAMVMGLHAAGLRVGMDVVYNHTTASGQHPQSVLDRIVPGYYQRLDALGRVERSTCCDNTATEHRMMGRLLVDSVVLWAREYKIASFRFDLMGHQPRAVMEQLQARLQRELGREVPLIGEGWNFGEIASGARFVQASQLSLNGTGIGTFSDRGRDAVRGGAAGDDAATSARRPGFIVPAAAGDAARREELLRQGDLLKLAMAGTLRGFELETADGRRIAGERLPYGDQPAGYASVPAEVVNYVENHDNQTLFDALVLKLPRTTTADDRARTQAVALGLNALSQGVAYFHAGGELLRSKSMDRNSYDSGDWFNRLDWSGRDNGFGAGLPPARDSAQDYALLRPLLADPAIKPGPAQIDWTRRVFLDQLRIRASTPLFRLADPQEIRRRLVFHNTGPYQQAGVIVARLDGAGRADAVFERVLVVVNATADAAALTLPAEAGFGWRLHPVQRAAGAADARVRAESRVDGGRGEFRVPARSVVVFVVDRR